MYITKVLKRGDAASVIVAVVLAFIVISILPNLVGELSQILTGTEGSYVPGAYYPGAGWQEVYLLPIVAGILQVVAVEIGLRISVAFRSVLVRKKK